MAYRCVFRGGFVPNNGGIGENGAEPSDAWPVRPIFLNGLKKGTPRACNLLNGNLSPQTSSLSLKKSGPQNPRGTLRSEFDNFFFPFSFFGPCGHPSAALSEEALCTRVFGWQLGSGGARRRLVTDTLAWDTQERGCTCWLNPVLLGCSVAGWSGAIGLPKPSATLCSEEV